MIITPADRKQAECECASTGRIYWSDMFQDNFHIQTDMHRVDSLYVMVVQNKQMLAEELHIKNSVKYFIDTVSAPYQRGDVLDALTRTSRHLSLFWWCWRISCRSSLFYNEQHVHRAASRGQSAAGAFSQSSKMWTQHNAFKLFLKFISFLLLRQTWS